MLVNSVPAFDRGRGVGSVQAHLSAGVWSMRIQSLLRNIIKSLSIQHQDIFGDTFSIAGTPLIFKLNYASWHIAATPIKVRAKCHKVGKKVARKVATFE